MGKDAKINVPHKSTEVKDFIKILLERQKKKADK